MLLGWIKLHRQLLDNWVMTEPEALSVWVRFLLEANHETKKKMINGSLVEIKRGQLVFGLEAFGARSGVSVSKLRRYLKLLESDGMIDRLKTAKYSIITIASFESYQGDDRQMTSKSQANDKQIATPKECKNDKNVNKQIYQQIADEFNLALPELGKVKVLSDKRISWIRASIKQMEKTNHDFSLLDTWSKYFNYVSSIDFLMGRKTDFTASFDFLVNKNNLLKVVEGNYDN